jgi:transcription elongation GreA/GreB family factor
MNEPLTEGVASTMRELEAGIADVEAELARTEEYHRKLEELARTVERCRELEEMIAVAKATLHAASRMPMLN